MWFQVDKTVVQPIVIGIAMYSVLIGLAYVQRDLTLTQLILMVVAPLLIGIFSRGLRRGLVLGFLVSFVMLIAELIILMPGAFINLDMVMVVIIMVLPWVALSTGLGAVGGLISKFIFKGTTGS